MDDSAKRGGLSTSELLQMSSNNDDTNVLNVKVLGVQGSTLKSSQNILRPPLAVSSVLLSARQTDKHYKHNRKYQCFERGDE